MKLFHKSKKTLSFFRKTFLSLLAATITITILLTLFLTTNYIKSSVSLITKFNDNMLSQSNYIVSSINDQVQRLIWTFFNDKDILAYLNMSSNDNRIPILASKALDKQLVTLPYISSIYLYNGNLDLFFSSQTGEQLLSEDFPDTDIKKLVKDKDFMSSYNVKAIPTNFNEDTSAQTISYIIFDSSSSSRDKKNAIVLNINTSLLMNSIEHMNDFQNDLPMNFIITEETGTVLCSKFNNDLSSSTDHLYSLLRKHISTNSLDSNKYIKIANETYLLSYTHANANNWYIIGLTPTQIIFQYLVAPSMITLSIMLEVFLLCWLLSLLYAKRLNHPIQAITEWMKGHKSNQLFHETLKTEEFQFIISVFESMRAQNDELDKIRRETAHSGKQDFLNHLISGNSIYTLEQITDKLKTFNLCHIQKHPLCMCVFKIDHYNDFLTSNNHKERWALRFAVVNIIEETITPHFQGDIFSHDSDKFVLLVNCVDEPDYKLFQDKLEKMLKEIQQNIENYIHLSISTAYSTFFKGLEHLPSMYNNMNNSLLLKLKYGHGSLITPYMVDDMNTDDFQLPLKKVEQLIDKIISANYDSSLQIYYQLSKQLFSYHYNEVISCIIHLIYSIYSSILQKYPRLKDTATLLLKDFMTHLQNAETSEDIDYLMDAFIENLCSEILLLKQNSPTQNTDVITQKVCEIIERDYSNDALCLSSIAEEMSLSPNYIGHLFKDSMQKSVAQYIIDLRMDKLAYYLHHTKLPLTTILEKVGIEKNNYFYTRFKKHFGMSLGEYKLTLHDRTEKVDQ